MKTSNQLMIFFVALSSFLNAQNTRVIQSEYFNGPEAVIYDAELKQYFVGNAGDGKIMTIDSLGNVEPFMDTIGANKIMSFEIIGDSLFASTNTPPTITCLNKITSEIIYQLNMDSVVGTFSQTAIDTRTNEIYIVVQQGAVYKVKPELGLIWEFANDGVESSSQTIEIDTIQNRLMVFYWNIPQVTYINLYDSTDVTTGPHIGSYQNTGSVFVEHEYIYLSTWSGSRIRRFHRDSVGETITFCNDSLSQPTGLTYNPDKEELATCNYQNNTVTIISTKAESPTGFGYNQLNKDALQIFNSLYGKKIFIKNPNDVHLISSVNIYNSVGQLVRRIVNPSSDQNQMLQIDCSDFSPGFFVVTIYGETQIIGSSKLVFK